MLTEQLLTQYGATKLKLRKGQFLFYEGEKAVNYFQVMQGAVKMITRTNSGKELIQGLFRSGESFGEPPLLNSFPYPSSAIAMEPSTVWRLPKDHFMELLRNNFNAHLEFDKVLCERLRYKTMLLTSISFLEPEEVIWNVILYYSKRKPLPKAEDGLHYIVPLTRQEIADMTGLRVETVIRTVKRMSEEGRLSLINHKIAVSAPVMT
ncbi:MAG: Crp/Fnr family transcriptional regulator [Bacteroidetes bacterium]|nr:Crp/Fnr family transcriptional regulator [Bacteroidota bacterium]